jgi:hypothetical protein
VPPAGIAVAVPVKVPKQVTLVWLVVTLSAAGSVMVTVAVAVHPLLSVTVTVYDPAARVPAVTVVCTGVVFHE